MALHTNLPIYKVAYDLLNVVADMVKNMPRDFKRSINEAIRRVSQIDAGELFETANSYFGLLRQASHSHKDRARLANVLRTRDHTISGDITKTYRRSACG